MTIQYLGPDRRELKPRDRGHPAGSRIKEKKYSLKTIEKAFKTDGENATRFGLFFFKGKSSSIKSYFVNG